jgi:hypothetical protein
VGTLGIRCMQQLRNYTSHLRNVKTIGHTIIPGEATKPLRNGVYIEIQNTDSCCFFGGYKALKCKIWSKWSALEYSVPGNPRILSRLTYGQHCAMSQKMATFETFFPTLHCPDRLRCSPSLLSNWYQGLRIRWLEREADDSPPCNAEVEYSWSDISTPSQVFIGQYSCKHRDFTIFQPRCFFNSMAIFTMWTSLSLSLSLSFCSYGVSSSVTVQMWRTDERQAEIKKTFSFLVSIKTHFFPFQFWLPTFWSRKPRLRL